MNKRLGYILLMVLMLAVISWSAPQSKVMGNDDKEVRMQNQDVRIVPVEK